MVTDGVTAPIDTALYATVWTSILFGSAVGAAVSSVVPSRQASWALCVTFLFLAFTARPLIQWMTTP
jgi:putative Ca2+/H+ antiporter (TMEM165/GDT1 family)